MKSNVCKIENGIGDLAAILKESEKVAVYNGLDKKQTLHLRLLCEELDGMLPNLVGNFEGDLWFEFDEGVCKICASIDIEDISYENKNELIKVAKSKKNAAATGIVGKIRATFENLILDNDFLDAWAVPVSGVESTSPQYWDVAYSKYWSLAQYRTAVKQEKADEAWDELEKSVIAKVADDVIVGIVGNRADVVVVKKFA